MGLGKVGDRIVCVVVKSVSVWLGYGFREAEVEGVKV